MGIENPRAQAFHNPCQESEREAEKHQEGADQDISEPKHGSFAAHAARNRAHGTLLNSVFSAGVRSSCAARVKCLAASSRLPAKASASPHFSCSRPQLGA